MQQAWGKKILQVIGKGSYRVVCAALDTHTGDKVAIKKINDVFEHISDALRIRELKLFRLLRKAVCLGKVILLGINQSMEVPSSEPDASTVPPTQLLFSLVGKLVCLMEFQQKSYQRNLCSTCVENCITLGSVSGSTTKGRFLTSLYVPLFLFKLAFSDYLLD